MSCTIFYNKIVVKVYFLNTLLTFEIIFTTTDYLHSVDENIKISTNLIYFRKKASYRNLNICAASIHNIFKYMCCLHTQYIFLFLLIGHSALYPFLDFINNHYLGNTENIIFFI